MIRSVLVRYNNVVVIVVVVVVMENVFFARYYRHEARLSIRLI